MIERWWENKYRTPLKAYEDHTEEELYVKMLEDYYDRNPSEIDRFWGSLAQDNWDGETDADYEREIKERLKSVSKEVDISKWQSDKDYSEDDVMDELRRQFPDKPSTMGDDIDDDYTVTKDILGKE